ncbi:MAG: PHP domain-containing protein, partial [Candidatus Omnitrophica bacterium]|nr:PHP domain-containing protein [Candidatus Omnitrophota bacterium]
MEELRRRADGGSVGQRQAFGWTLNGKGFRSSDKFADEAKGRFEQAKRDGRAMAYARLPDKARREIEQAKFADILDSENIRIVMPEDAVEPRAHPFLWLDKSEEEGIVWIEENGIVYLPLYLVKLLIIRSKKDLLSCMLGEAGASCCEEKQRLTAEIFLLWIKSTIEYWHIRPQERLKALEKFKMMYRAGYVHRDFNMKGRMDLHTHTIYSDGRFTPTHLVLRYWLKGLSVMAITDHNTFDGVWEGAQAAAILGDIELIPGMELTVFTFEVGAEKMHSLLLWKGDNPSFFNWLNAMQESNRLEGIEIKRARAVEVMEVVRTRFNKKHPERAISSEDVLEYHPLGARRLLDLTKAIFRKHGPEGDGTVVFDDMPSIRDELLGLLPKDYEKDGHFNLKQAIEFRIENNFHLIFAHPLYEHPLRKDQWDEIKIAEVLRRYARYPYKGKTYPGFSGIELLDCDEKNRDAINRIVRDLNSTDYKPFPLKRSPGSDTHRDFDRPFGIYCPTFTFEGELALEVSMESAALLCPERRVRYFADLFFRWAGLSLRDEIRSCSRPVWSKGNRDLGVPVASGVTATISPAVIEHLLAHKDTFPLRCRNAALRSLLYSMDVPESYRSEVILELGRERDSGEDSVSQVVHFLLMNDRAHWQAGVTLNDLRDGMSSLGFYVTTFDIARAVQGGYLEEIMNDEIGEEARYFLWEGVDVPAEIERIEKSLFGPENNKQGRIAAMKTVMNHIQEDSIPSKHFVSLLLHVVRHDGSRWMRWLAAKGLELIASEKTLHGLTVALSEEQDENVRRAICRAIERIEGQQRIKEDLSTRFHLGPADGCFDNDADRPTMTDGGADAAAENARVTSGDEHMFAETAEQYEERLRIIRKAFESVPEWNLRIFLGAIHSQLGEVKDPAVKNDLASLYELFMPFLSDQPQRSFQTDFLNKLGCDLSSSSAHKLAHVYREWLKEKCLAIYGRGSARDTEFYILYLLVKTLIPAIAEFERRLSAHPRFIENEFRLLLEGQFKNCIDSTSRIEEPWLKFALIESVMPVILRYSNRADQPQAKREDLDTFVKLHLKRSLDEKNYNLAYFFIKNVLPLVFRPVSSERFVEVLAALFNFCEEVFRKAEDVSTAMNLIVLILEQANFENYAEIRRIYDGVVSIYSDHPDQRFVDPIISVIDGRITSYKRILKNFKAEGRCEIRPDLNQLRKSEREMIERLAAGRGLPVGYTIQGFLEAPLPLAYLQSNPVYKEKGEGCIAAGACVLGTETGVGSRLKDDYPVRFIDSDGRGYRDTIYGWKMRMFKAIGNVFKTDIPVIIEDGFPYGALKRNDLFLERFSENRPWKDIFFTQPLINTGRQTPEGRPIYLSYGSWGFLRGLILSGAILDLRKSKVRFILHSNINNLCSQMDPYLLGYFISLIEDAEKNGQEAPLCLAELTDYNTGYGEAGGAAVSITGTDGRVSHRILHHDAWKKGEFRETMRGSRSF